MEKPNSKINMQLDKINDFLNNNDCITNSDVQELFGVSSATAKRILAKLIEAGKLNKIRLGRSWGYEKIE